MLFKKLFRTFWVYKAQFISMIIMIGIGVGIFFGFNLEWYSLKVDTDEIYEATGFADFRVINEGGFSKADLDKVTAIEGVTDATRFLSVNTTVQNDTDIVAITVSENMKISGVLVTKGEDYDPKSPDGIWLSDSFAAANDIKVGDEMTFVYKSITLSGKVKGLVKASEYLICLPDETQVMPDFHSYGYAYVSPVLIGNALDKLLPGLGTAGFYPQIHIKSDLDKKELVGKLDAAFGKTYMVLSKDETASWSEAQGEVNEGKTMGSVLPVLFLAIAILTMVTTMHRITASEKTQIGTLKALGYRDARILRHYTSYALLIGLMGTLLGIGIGYLLGWYIMNPNGAMGTYIDMPSWRLYVPWFCWLVIALMNLFLTAIGFLSVKKMLQGTAADALRPYSPKRMKHMWIEETKAFKALGFGIKWNLRDCLRHKARSAMTLFGIIGCTLLIVGSMGMYDTMDAFMDGFYDKAINYKTRVYLDTESITNDEAVELAKQYDADWCAQRSIQIEDKGFALEIYSVTHDKVRFPDQDMNFFTLSDDGAYVCGRIARDFNLKKGDLLSFEPFGSDEKYTVPIAGIVSSLSESIVMTKDYAEKAGIPYTVSTLFTDETEIAQNQHILNSQSKKSIMDSFDTFMELMNVMIVLLVIAAVVLGIVVLYNLGIMSYTERYREMATLKVVGFKNSKIARLLIGQNLWLTVIGIIIGIPVGVAVLKYLLVALASEYELKLVLGPATYLTSILLTFSVSFIVGLMVARKNKHIDMVAALKTEE